MHGLPVPWSRLIQPLSLRLWPVRPIPPGRILSSGLFSNETRTLQRIPVVSAVLHLSHVELKFLNEISGLGGIRFAEEGANGRARLGPTFATYCPGLIFGHFLPLN
jgi:hypothetical protein